jgi:hypothetical protein
MFISDPYFYIRIRIPNLDHGSKGQKALDPDPGLGYAKLRTMLYFFLVEMSIEYYRYVEIEASVPEILLSVFQ